MQYIVVGRDWEFRCEAPLKEILNGRVIFGNDAVAQITTGKLEADGCVPYPARKSRDKPPADQTIVYLGGNATYEPDVNDHGLAVVTIDTMNETRLLTRDAYNLRFDF